MHGEEDPLHIRVEMKVVELLVYSWVNTIRATREENPMQLQADYVAAYRSLKLTRDADGVLVVEFHSKGGPFHFHGTRSYAVCRRFFPHRGAGLRSTVHPAELLTIFLYTAEEAGAALKKMATSFAATFR